MGVAPAVLGATDDLMGQIARFFQPPGSRGQGGK